MTEQKQPEALRIATTLDALDDFQFNKASAELRRQHAEIESLQDDLAHKDDYAEQLGRELAKADSVIKELRAKLDELEEQEPYKYMGRSGTLFNERIPGIESKALYLAAGARPVEPVQKLRPDFIAGYDAGMADAKRIQAHQPAPAAVVGPTNKVLWLLMAQYGLNMTVGQDMDNLLNFGRDVWNAALSATQPAPAAQDDAKETARLDYLQEHGATVDLVTSGSRFYPLRFRIGGLQSTANSDLRTAIDAAIAASKKEPT